MKKESLKRSLPIVATTLCARFGVDIFLAGNEAKTDGKAIYLPSLLDSKLDPTVLYGYLLHESGHVRLSQFGCRSKFPQYESLHHAILNILEDGRIEREMSEIFSGGFHWIKTMDAYTIRDPNAIGNPSNFRMPEKKPLEVLIEYVFFWTRVNFINLRDLYSDGHDCSEKRLIDAFGAVFKADLFLILNKSLKAKSTRALSTFVDQIIELLLKNQKENQQSVQQQQQQSEPNPNQEDQSSSDAKSVPMNGAPSKESQDGNGQSTNGQDDSGQEIQPSDSCAASAVLESKPSAISDVSQNADSANAVAKALISEAEQGTAFGAERVGYIDVGSLIEGLKKDLPEEFLSKNLIEQSNVLDESKRIAMRLERSLRTKIEARKRNGMIHTHSGNKLNHRRLASFVTGNTKVFGRKVENREVNTAIDIMLDLSGSMRSNGIHLAAKKAAIAFAMATYRIPGVDVGICTFSDCMSSQRSKVISHLEHKARLTSQVLKELASIQPMGGTPSAEAVLASTHRLSKCTQSTRHILFFITDGDVLAATPIIKRLQSGDIESRALFITNDQLPDVFDHETMLSPTATSDSITKSILELMSESVLS